MVRIDVYRSSSVLSRSVLGTLYSLFQNNPVNRYYYAHVKDELTETLTLARWCRQVDALRGLWNCEVVKISCENAHESS